MLPMNRDELVRSIAMIIADYRVGDGSQISEDHIERWISQFPIQVQNGILCELNFVLGNTYFSRTKVERFLDNVLGTRNLVGDDPLSFWRNVNFLDIQQGGNSQHEMLEIMNSRMNNRFGFGVQNNCGSGTFVYLDDAVYTGNRVRRDIESWLENSAPQIITLHIVTIAYFNGGKHYAEDQIKAKAQSLGKSLNLQWWRCLALEDRRAHSNRCDVLRPVAIPSVPEVTEYIQTLSYPPLLRHAGHLGVNNLFSSDQGKQLLEQEFLKTGAVIRTMCPNLSRSSRPLGHMSLESVGFGAMIVTFRNCPNNAPLALWVGPPWYPLFPRTTNADSAVRRLFG